MKKLYFAPCIIYSTDIDECALNIDNCDDQTTLCSNNFGSFDCVCLVGYHILSGTVCQREC